MGEINAKVTFVDGLQFVGEGETGHAIVMDGSPMYGGRNTGSSPMELLLIGLGGCTGMDVVSILRKKKQPFTGLEVRVKGKKADEQPSRYTDIEIEFVITGKDVDEEAVKRAIELSMDKYCSVKASLESPANVTFSYTITG